MTLDKLFDWVGNNLPEVKESLNPPATEDEIKKTENMLSVTLPIALKEMYQRHNGQNGKLASEQLGGEPVSSENVHLWRIIPGLFYGLPFLSLNEMVEEWESWVEALDNPYLDAEDMNAMSSSHVPGLVKPVSVNRKWIPFTSGPDHLGIDLDPGPKGTVGQVINFGRDEDVKYVIANSFGEFLEWYVTELDAGNFTIVEWQGSGTGREFLIKTPENQHFLDAIKEIFD